MQNSIRGFFQYFAVPALAGAIWISLPNPHAQARPQYLKQFASSYPALKEQAAETKCGVCHAPGSKKERNIYGVAVRKALKQKENIKDPQAIVAALKAAEKLPSSLPNQTFGELIKSGKLPE